MSDPRPATLTACHLGPLGYREAIALQEALVLARAEGRTGDWLLFPDHPPVLTVGRGARPGGLRVSHAELAALGTELFEVARGGDITWHGPGQLVGYAILDLAGRGRDLHGYLRGLEASLVRLLAGLGIAGHTAPGRTGVWVGEEKVASIGIAVRRWVSYYGFALNVAPDLARFDVIHPCGLRGVRMTSLARLLGERAPTLAAARAAAAGELAREYGYADVAWAPAQAAWRAAGASAGREPRAQVAEGALGA